MTSALNLISENCKHPFPFLCLILSISSLPEDHLSSLLSYCLSPHLVLHASLWELTCWETGCQGLFQPSAFSPHTHSPLSFFPLLSSFFFFTNGSWLSIHIPLRVDNFALAFFSMDLLLPLLSQWPLAYTLCLWGKRIQRFILKWF